MSNCCIHTLPSLFLPGVVADLDQIPQNVAGVVGNTVKLTCTGKNVSNLIWERSNIENPNEFVAVAGSRIKSDFDKTNQQSTLTITNLETGDAGTYKCKTGEDNPDEGYAQVVVLGKYHW